MNRVYVGKKRMARIRSIASDESGYARDVLREWHADWKAMVKIVEAAKDGHFDDFFAEGNNGGDYLKLEVVKRSRAEDLIQIEVGSSCVVRCRAIVPVSALTTILAHVLGDGIEKAFREISEWPAGVEDTLARQIEVLK